MKHLYVPFYWLFVCSALSIFSVTPVKAGPAAGQQEDIRVKVDTATGNYAVSSARLGWTFSGSVGAPLHDLRSASGRDAAGKFSAVRFKWKDGINYAGRIRWYADQPVVIFDLTLPEGAQERSPAAFPDFTAYPDLPHRFSYHNRIFPLPQFFLEETCTPWMLFNDQAAACILSPASDFIVSLMTHADSTRLRSGLNPEVKHLPAGFTHSTILVMAQGIRHSWDTWGTALRALYDRKRPANDSDPILKYFGYWTDNGADYYYNYDSTKGYAGTLLAVKEHYRQKGIPLGYMQLDSWWYEKSNYNMDRNEGRGIKNPLFPAGPWNLSGGLIKYEADTFLFPDGLAAFQKRLGLPLVTHNRWMDPGSPYHEKYRISGFAPIDTAYWRHIMKYLKNSGVTCYEQDWMNYAYTRDPEMISDIRIGNAFTDGMALAARENGISLQYCMALPRYFMQGLKYNNLTTIRVSGDGFMPKRWKNFVFVSQFAYEMGIWPWSDVFKSNESGNMILSVLSAGAVGTGDSLGKEIKANILQACRQDGILVKPDLPLMPADQSYLQMARGEDKPVLGYTYTRHGGITTGYVFAFAEEGMKGRAFNMDIREIGIEGKAVAYDLQRNIVRVIGPGQVFKDELPEDGYACYMIAPVTRAGIAFLGDAGKITATGKKRIAAIVPSDRGIKTDVLFAGGESSVMLRGYAERPVTADKGKMNYDPATHLFTLNLPAPAKGNRQTVNITTIKE